MSDTFENLLEEFYKHCPLAEAMCLDRQVATIAYEEGTKEIILHPLSDVEQVMLAGGDLDCDEFLIRTHGESVMWTQARTKVKAIAQYLNRFLVVGIDGKLPAVQFGQPTEFGPVTHEFKIGRDMSGFDDKGVRFASDGEAVLLFRDARARFTKPTFEFVSVPEKPVRRIRMEMYYYVLKEQRNP